MDIVDRIFKLVDLRYDEQKKFAFDLGVPPSRVSEWRARKSSSYNRRLGQIANILGTTPDYLLNGDTTLVELLIDLPPQNSMQELLDLAEMKIPNDLANLREFIDEESSEIKNSENCAMYVNLKICTPNSPPSTKSIRLTDGTLSNALKTDLQAAFWGGEKDLTQEDLDAMWADVENFAAFVAQKRRQEKKND